MNFTNTDYSVSPEKKPISKDQLMLKAIELMKECDDYIDGILPTDVKEVNGTFVFTGEYFLREDGTPSTKTLAVFNVFKFLNHRLSGQFYLEQ